MKKCLETYISLRAAILLLLAIVASASPLIYSLPVHAASNPTGEFYIVGPNIVTPNGENYFPVGANVGAPGNFDWHGNADGQSSAALAWGWNTIRLNMYCTTAQSYSTWSEVGYPTLKSEIAAVIKEYTAKKIVVIIACHDGVHLSDTVHTAQLEQFWTDMAKTYKSNPYVWFNDENEIEWNNNVDFLNFHRHYLNIIRSQGAENIFVADVMNAGNDAGWAGAKRIYEPTMGPALANGECNVLFSMHDYGGIEDSLKSGPYWKDVHAAGLAMIVGEYGYTRTDTDLTDQNHRGAAAVFNIAPSLGVGSLVWHATFGGDNYSVKNNDDPFYANAPVFNTNLTDLGMKLWTLGHTAHNLGAFTGGYASSNCVSAGGTSLPIPTPIPTVKPAPTPTSKPTPKVSTTPVIQPSVKADLNKDGHVNTLDLSILISDWGKAGADLNNDGVTNVLDLSFLLAAWKN